MSPIKIIESGTLTTIQDTGRYGYQKFGMPVAGAMDKFSLRAANSLVGNEQTEAALEFTISGPKMKFISASVVAITGGNFTPYLNECQMPAWQSFFVPEDSVLEIKSSSTGIRGYIAFEGGVKADQVLGSKSTYLQAKLGGYRGRKLKKNDIVKLEKEAKSRKYYERIFPEDFIPDIREDMRVRVILGPQENHFSERGIETFLNEKYSITSSSDRMGYRLKGAEIEHQNEACSNIISDGIPPGAVQVPGHKNPIIMLADRQTTGGYPKIATISSVDLDRLAQLKAGDKVHFSQINLETAHGLLKEREKAFENIEEKKISGIRDRYYRIEIANKFSYKVKVEELEDN